MFRNIVQMIQKLKYMSCYETMFILCFSLYNFVNFNNTKLRVKFTYSKVYIKT